MALALAHPVLAAPATTWEVAGRQGVVRLVIVPTASATDRAAYDAQIGRLCEPDRTCFLNFYTNSTGARLGVPLPDSIAHEATALFRRSMKSGGEMFQWSCRLKIGTEACF